MRFYGGCTQKNSKNKSPPGVEGSYIIRHRAIFPGLDDPSILTAARLNCCVRYGNRCFPSAMDTDKNLLKNRLLSASIRCKNK